MEKRQLNARVPGELYQQVKVECANLGIDLQDGLTAALAAWVSKSNAESRCAGMVLNWLKEPDPEQPLERGIANMVTQIVFGGDRPRPIQEVLNGYATTREEQPR